MDEGVKLLTDNPYIKANSLSRLFFSWVTPLFFYGRKNTLHVENLYKVLPEDSSENISDRIERSWNEQLNKKKPSLLKVLVKIFGFKYALLGIILFFEGVCNVIQPVFLAQLVRYFLPGSNMTAGEAYLYAFGISFCASILVLTHHPYFYVTQQMGMQIRIGCCSLIYRKVLKLSNKAFSKTKTGHIVNLISNDVNRFDQALIFIHYLWIAPLQILVAMVLLWNWVGPSCLAGLAVIVLQSPFQVYLGKAFSKLRAKTAIKTDSRVNIMNEIISGMRVIKMYTWEKPFAQLIRRVRREEIGHIKIFSYLKSIQAAIYFSSHTLYVLVFVIAYTLTGSTLKPDILFSIVALFNVMRKTFSFYLLRCIENLAQTGVSIRRVQTFLLLEEQDPAIFYRKTSLRPKSVKQCEVDLKNFTGSWDESLENPTLQNISCSVKAGELLAVIGPVGAGKSSLLMAILQEMRPLEGRVNVKGNLAYASQQPWVFSASLKQNILFGRTYSKEKFEKIISICSLKMDIEMLPDKEMTLVGERGVTLSGGQRARVSLARALYSDADIYLMDDPLSAVDTTVGREIFNNCIMGYLKDKPKILVTHQLQYLEIATKIIILKDGQILGAGKFNELKNSGIDFSSLLSENENLKPTPQISGENSQLSQLLSRENLSKSKPLLMSIPNFLPETKSTISLETFEVKEEEPEIEFSVIKKEEDRQEGTVGAHIYLEYFRSGVGLFGFIILSFSCLITQALYIYSDWWLAYWATSEENAAELKILNLSNGNMTLNSVCEVCNISSLDNGTLFPLQEDPENPNTLATLTTTQGLYTYVILVSALLIASFWRAIYFFYVAVNASKNLHNKMFAAIIRAPIYFFDTNPVGRILNRFTRDIGFMDDLLPMTFFDAIQLGILSLGIIIVAGIVNPWVFIPTIPLLVIFCVLRSFFLKTSRDIKRLEGITRSPVFSHVSATLQGLWTIRAFNAEDIFIKEFDSHQDLHTAGWNMFLVTSRWFGVRIDWLCVFFIASVAFCSVLAAGGLDPGLVGLSLSYSLTLMGSFQWCVRQSAEVENQMTSVERVVSYSKLEPEAPLETDVKPDPDWPAHGAITMKNVSLSYSIDSPDVLKKLCLCIRAKEKVGIVGRTGAGKSSFLAALFRMVEPRGLIQIDGLSISDIGLHDLRKTLSIIPQDPVLFAGTLRKNLDPFSEYTDAELWQSLEKVQLKLVVEELEVGLETEISEGGSNLSVGQRQLVCLARAILKSNRILLVDEATANVDPRTDELIQKTVRTEFKNCTVLTIAHRLHTIMDSERVLVLHDGKMVEFEQPHVLMNNRNGHFYQMVAETGKVEFLKLYKIAEEAYDKHQSSINPINGIKENQNSHFSPYIPSAKNILLELESTV